LLRSAIRYRHVIRHLLTVHGRRRIAFVRGEEVAYASDG